jgi:thiol-disulfide isomerase/thioredoxin
MTTPEGAICEGGVCRLPDPKLPRAGVSEGIPAAENPLVSVLEGTPLSTADGAPSGADFLGDARLLVLYFGASWCPPCRALSPSLATFSAREASRVAFVHVPFDHSSQEASSYATHLREKGGNWALASEPGPLASRYGVRTLPTVVVVGQSDDGGSPRTITTWGRSAVMKNSRHCVDDWLQGKEGVTWLQLLKFW